MNNLSKEITFNRICKKKIPKRSKLFAQSQAMTQSHIFYLHNPSDESPSELKGKEEDEGGEEQAEISPNQRTLAFRTKRPSEDPV